MTRGKYHDSLGNMETAIETTTKAPRQGYKRTKTTPPVQIANELAFKALMSKGLTANRAAVALGMSEGMGYKILDRLKDRGEDIAPFLTASRDEKFGKFVDHFIDAGIRKKNKDIKGSDALGAAKLYADRRYPVRAPDGGAGSVSYTEVNVVLNLGQSGPSREALGPLMPESIDVTGLAGTGDSSIQDARKESNAVEIDYSL